jgi:transcriptional regulator with XRE-family HTH domain
MKPIQCRMARAALGWSTADLAREARVGANTINRFEAGQDARMSSVNKTRAALEAAGVEFMNGDAPGVRLKSANVRMTQKQFNGRLHRYDQQRLRLKGIVVGGETLPRFDFVFVYRDNTAIDLMLDGRVIGSAIWSDGTVTFDPAVPSRSIEAASDNTDIFDEWVSLAYHRNLSTGG